MNIAKAIGYGLVLYALMLLIALLLRFGLNLSGEILSISVLLSSILVLCILSHQYGIKSQLEGVILGMIWVAIIILLDYLMTVLIFEKWRGTVELWAILVGYVLTILIPGLAGSREKSIP